MAREVESTRYFVLMDGDRVVGVMNIKESSTPPAGALPVSEAEARQARALLETPAPTMREGSDIGRRVAALEAKAALHDAAFGGLKAAIERGIK